MRGQNYVIDLEVVKETQRSAWDSCRIVYALLSVRQEKKCLLRIGTQTGAVMTHRLQTASNEMFVEGTQRSWKNLWSPEKYYANYELPNSKRRRRKKREGLNIITNR